MRTNLYLIETASKHGIPLVGVENKDTLDRLPLQDGAGYIINLQNEKAIDGKFNFGTHWVALWIENNAVVFFDPFGIIPTFEIQNFICRLRGPIYYNKKEIQNVHAGNCGDYCLFFLKFMSDNKRRIPDLYNRLKSFQNIFVSDTSQNTKILHDVWPPSRQPSR